MPPAFFDLSTLDILTMLEKDKTYNIRLKGILGGKQVLTSVKVTDIVSQLPIAKLIRPTVVIENSSIEQQAGVTLPLVEVSNFYIMSQGEESFLIPESWIETFSLLETSKTLYLTLENINSPLESEVRKFLTEMNIIYKVTK